MSPSELTKNAESRTGTSGISATGTDEVQSVALHRCDGVPSSTSEVAATLPTAAAIGEVLTVDEVAALARLDRNTVYGCIRRGELAACRCGRIIRVHREAVVDWLCGNTRVTRSSRRRSS